MQPATFTKSSLGLKKKKKEKHLFHFRLHYHQQFIPCNLALCSMFLMSQQLDGYGSPAHVPLQQTKVLLSFPTDAKICHVILLPAGPKEKVINIKNDDDDDNSMA